MHLFALIPGQGASQLLRQLADMLGKRTNNSRRVLAGDLDEHREAGVALVCGAQVPNVGGKYEGMINVTYKTGGQGEQKLSITVEQIGKDLKVSYQTGAGGQGKGAGTLADGGSSESISLQSTAPECPGSYQASLKYAEDAITLSYKGEDCGGPVEGHGTAKRAKDEPIASNISGSWKIDSKNGPSPLCGFIQAGNNLTGSCTGPKSAGTITGNIVGKKVQWRWQWATYAGDAAAAFDFVGTLGPDNTITGMVERQEIGLSLNFTAVRQ
jgi:hypothetical protein